LVFLRTKCTPTWNEEVSSGKQIFEGEKKTMKKEYSQNRMQLLSQTLSSTTLAQVAKNEAHRFPTVNVGGIEPSNAK
jgi:hypothetical protein